MSHRPTRRTLLAACASAAAVALSGCGLSGDPLASSGGAAGCPTEAPRSGPVRVGSANFPESTLIADVYAGALRAKGIKATTTDPIGAREAYLKALGDGSVQVVPEYTGSLLTFLAAQRGQPAPTVKAPDEVYAALRTTVDCRQVLLERSAAQDSNAIVVTRATAQRWGLRTISDLARHAGEVTIAAPPEFRGREQGLVGLRSVYGMTPRDFRPLGTTTAIVSALRNGQAQAANIFSTDPSITVENLVVLRDDKQLFGADNVVPLVSRSAATPQVQAALDAVSRRLTTPVLAGMLKQVVVDRRPSPQVAREFLRTQGLG